MGPNVRILVIGKANLMRDGLVAILSAQEGFQVLASIDSDVGSIESAASTPPPDVALMHLRVFSASGFSAIAALRRRWPGVRILALTSRMDEYRLGATPEVGIDGYILEGDSHTELLLAVRSLFAGERYLSASVCFQEVGGAEKLTEREKEVMRLIAAGQRTREMAQRLSVSLKTVEKHRASLMRKLGLRSAAAVAAYAIAHGYVVV